LALGVQCLVRRWHDLDAFEGLFLQGLAMFGIGDLDEFVHPLADVLAEKRGNSVLRDDVVNVGTRGDDASAWKGLRISCGSSSSKG